MKEKIAWILLTIIGVLSLLNGVGNIFDDAAVKVYDITAILVGLGFIIIGVTNRKKR